MRLDGRGQVRGPHLLFGVDDHLHVEVGLPARRRERIERRQELGDRTFRIRRRASEDAPVGIAIAGQSGPGDLLPAAPAVGLLQTGS